MGETARALGIGSSVAWKGKTYELGQWTYGVQAKVEMFFRSRAWRAAEASKQWLSPGDYKEALASVSRDIAAGLYDFGSEIIAKGLQELPGLTYLVYLLLHERDNSVTQELAKEIVEGDLESIARKINEAAADPTQPTQNESGKP